MTVERGDLVNVLLGDLRNAPEKARQQGRQSQHDYVTEWSELICDPTGLDPTAARIQVQAALMILNDGARTPT